ncbi:VTT domain-containing protein [Fredinandcohnia sp. QZ13]|uniref:DedA family protein n=1 Tax=Fredinandcohnia sp. QZ13 TaxID=3073144 RepID=UPI0028536820|nr:VTT domain-containing protein [Fredinandcohnia sp. QZ13]MDR4889399.1 VTT domain-containing protein [Fredinandcohnia sp. QZ13]
MQINEVVSIIQEHGYLGLYLWLWVGAFVIPIPNEVIVSTIGFFAAEDVFVPWKIFFVTYFGILAAVTTSYVLGRFAGNAMVFLMNKQNKMRRKVERALLIIEKYNTFALAFCYFLPGFRVLFPFLFGFSKFSFLKFALTLYTTIFIWVSIVFSVGYFAGEEFIEAFIKYYDIFVGVAVTALMLYVLIKIRRRRKLRKFSH